MNEIHIKSIVSIANLEKYSHRESEECTLKIQNGKNNLFWKPNWNPTISQQWHKLTNHIIYVEKYEKSFSFLYFLYEQIYKDNNWNKWKVSSSNNQVILFNEMYANS